MFAQIKLYLIAGAILAAAAGGWEVNGWRLGKEIAQTAADSAQAAEKARKAADAKTADMQTESDQRALALSQLVESTRRDYADKLEASRAELARLSPMPMPVAAVGVLVDAGSDSGAVPAPAGTAGGTADAGGTVDASAVIESCEENRGTFERNRERLDALRGWYDAIRAKTNPAGAGAP